MITSPHRLRIVCPTPPWTIQGHDQHDLFGRGQAVQSQPLYQFGLRLVAGQALDANPTLHRVAEQEALVIDAIVRCATTIQRHMTVP